MHELLVFPSTLIQMHSSSLRNRTSEFAAVVERIRKQQGISSPATSSTGDTYASVPIQGGSSDPYSQHLGHRVDQASSSSNQHSEFSRRAADIGHGIHRTSLKLAKLAQLAKRTSAFDDPANEVEELTGMIKQDIQARKSMRHMHEGNLHGETCMG